MPVIPATQEAEAGELKVTQTSSQKQDKSKRAGAMTQEAEHLLSKCETLDSIASTTRGRKYKKKVWNFSE
jgi:hypothetical protein